MGTNLEKTIDGIKDDYGEGSVRWMDDDSVVQTETISTGSISLDHATGIGGFPRGRITEVYGKQSSGKTSIAMEGVVQAQKEGGKSAFIDAENAFDPNYAQAMGMDLSNLLYHQPSSAEEALDVFERLVRSKELDMVALDSIAALVPQTEKEGDMGDQHVGLQAKLMSQAMRKTMSSIQKSGTAVVFTNQIRSTISGSSWGKSTTTPGGRAVKFFAALRLKLYISGTIDKNSTSSKKIGNEVVARVEKNKLAPPFREAEFDIIYGEGISRARELLHLGAEYDIIERKGPWYSYGEEKLGQGINKAQSALKEDSELANEIENKIMEALD